MKDALTEEFISFIYRISTDQIPLLIERQVKRCLLDYIGVTFAGAKLLKNRFPNIQKDFIATNNGESSVIGFNSRANYLEAAFLNGLSSHIAELDDGSRYGAIHPGCVIISSLLPLAQEYNISPHNLLLGIFVGYEASIRIASSIQPSHYEIGYHTTSTCGSIGAAVGISAMMKFSEKQMRDAFSAAVLTSSGMLKVIEDDSDLKPYNVGRSVQSAIYSSLAGKLGFKGPKEVLAGTRGYFSMVSREIDANKLLSKNIQSYCISKVYFKIYPSCRHTHAPIDAAIKLRNSCKINEIERINIYTYSSIIGKHDHREILGISSAKMSIPFCVSLGFFYGKVKLEYFVEENIKNNELLSLTKKVHVIGDKYFSSLIPEKRGAKVEVLLKNGAIFSEIILSPKGEPEDPLEDQDLQDKFYSLTKYADLTREQSTKISDSVWNIETQLENLFLAL